MEFEYVINFGDGIVYFFNTQMAFIVMEHFYYYGFIRLSENYLSEFIVTINPIGIIHRFSRLVTLLFHKLLHVRLNHKDACILTLT